MNIYLEIYMLVGIAFYLLFGMAFIYEFGWLGRRRVRPVDIVTSVLFPPLWPIGATCFLLDFSEAILERIAYSFAKISSLIKKYFFQKIFKLIAKMFKLEQKEY